MREIILQAAPLLFLLFLLSAVHPWLPVSFVVLLVAYVAWVSGKGPHDDA